jgi:hypothetical protein
MIDGLSLLGYAALALAGIIWLATKGLNWLIRRVWHD